jgi:hypothetical protein
MKYSTLKRSRFVDALHKWKLQSISLVKKWVIACKARVGLFFDESEIGIEIHISELPAARFISYFSEAQK